MPQKLIENFKKIVTEKYFCFEGRAGKEEFWFWVLVMFIVSVVLGFIPRIGPILGLIWSLGLLLPGLGVTARRLHDQDKSGWLILLGLVPFIGGLIVLILCIPEGTKDANQYGPAPIAPVIDAVE